MLTCVFHLCALCRPLTVDFPQAGPQENKLRDSDVESLDLQLTKIVQSAAMQQLTEIDC